MKAFKDILYKSNFLEGLFQFKIELVHRNCIYSYLFGEKKFLISI